MSLTKPPPVLYLFLFLPTRFNVIVEYFSVVLLFGDLLPSTEVDLSAFLPFRETPSVDALRLASSVDEELSRFAFDL